MIKFFTGYWSIVLKKINKFVFYSIFLLSGLLSLRDCCSAAIITSFTCTSPVEVTTWPRNVFRSTCSVVVEKMKGYEKPCDIGVSLNSYTTEKTYGNGPNLDVRNPENPIYRLRVDGDVQSGNPANITTNLLSTNSTLINSGITANGTYTFDLLYTTYQADSGGTSYIHPVMVNLYTQQSTSPIDSSSYNFSFTVKDYSELILSGPLTISLLPSQLLSLGQVYNSNMVTASIYANNTWKLQTRISGITGLTHYYRVSSAAIGNGFSNLANTRSQFLLNDTNYDLAQNLSGAYTTGTSNSMSLNPVNVMFAYSYLNAAVITAGNYIYSTTLTSTAPQ